MPHVILIQGLVNGEPSPYDGEYLGRMDFEDCEPGECNLETTPDPERALHFKDIIAAREMWVTVDPRNPVRLDGKPNRPLTAFSVTIEPLKSVSQT
jgi:hypothetical protein